jgi:hypothetical protein
MERQQRAIQRPDTKSDLSFPPPFAQQAKYLALADQFLGVEITRKDERYDKATDFRKHFKHPRKKAA